jgi:hypothetical protein
VSILRRPDRRRGAGTEEGTANGYIAGPASGREHPPGIGGERLIAEHVARPGAVVMGHGMYITVVQQFIRAGWLDELLLHVVPVLAGGGRWLFDGLGDQHIEWEKTQVLDSPGVTHIRLRSPHTVSAE